ncbi:hypothetical protein [Thorsellia kenyensis]|uniref:DUF3298 domain-containing protein n=1 Tax=Thorsellia kenyensis TaxID=1549888 RepID=A0ABV6CCA5_9GAMM
MSRLFFHFKKVIYLLPLILFVIQARATVFEGLIDNRAIVMEVEKNDFGFYGQYFFKDEGKNRTLSSDLTKENVLIEGDDDSGNLGFYFSKTTPPYKGFYFDKIKKIELPFEIFEIKSLPTDTNNSIALQNFSNNNIYEYLRQKTFSFDKTHTEKFQGYEIQWHKENNSNLSFFTRVPSSDENLQDVIMINNYLEIKFRQYISQSFGCENKKYLIEPSFLNKNITSFYFSGSFICDNSYSTNFYRELVNLDNATGQSLSLNDIVTLPKDITLEKWIIEQLTDLYPVLMSDPECPYQEETTWNKDNQIAWIITSQGIEFRPQIEDMITICNATDWAVLPFDVLREFKSSKNPLQL